MANPANELMDQARSALHLATPQALGRMMLRQDPQVHRIEASRIAALIEAALADGAALAREAADRCGDDPAELLKALAIEVIEARRDAGYGRQIVHAQYWQRPPRVELFLPALDELQRGIAQCEMHALLYGRTVRDIFLAHELYHHLDLTRGGLSIAAAHRVTLLRIGPWKWTSGLASLAEIAAGAFAQALLDLPYHPKLLDLITLIDRAPHSAERFLERLRGAGSDAGAAAYTGRLTR